MKTTYKKYGGLGQTLVVLALQMMAVLAFSLPAKAELLVADPNGVNGIRSYNDDGTLINSSLLPGTSYEGLALSGTNLYVADPGNGTVNNGLILESHLDGSGGASPLSYFASGGGLTAPFGLATSGTNLWVADFNSGYILKYDLGSGSQVTGLWNGYTDPYGLAIYGDTLWVSQATTGAGSNTISGYSLSNLSDTPILTITSNLNIPLGLAVSGNTLYVVNGGDGTIWSFDAATGSSIGELISGLIQPQGLAIDGSNLYVTGGDGTVKGFDTGSGDPLVGFTTITGLSSPNGIVVYPTSVPEPANCTIIGVLILGFLAWYRRRRTIG